MLKNRYRKGPLLGQTGLFFPVIWLLEAVNKFRLCLHVQLEVVVLTCWITPLCIQSLLLRYLILSVIPVICPTALVKNIV